MVEKFQREEALSLSLFRISRLSPSLSSFILNFLFRTLLLPTALKNNEATEGTKRQL